MPAGAVLDGVPTFFKQAGLAATALRRGRRGRGLPEISIGILHGSWGDIRKRHAWFPLSRFVYDATQNLSAHLQQLSLRSQTNATGPWYSLGAGVFPVHAGNAMNF